MIPLVWVFYFPAAEQLIGALHGSENSWLADRLMPGRRSTNVEAYYRRANAALLYGTVLAILIGMAAWLLLRKAAEVFLFLLSCFVCSLLVFVLLERFPGLIPLTRLDRVLGYYSFKVNYIPDSELVYTEKPFNRRSITEFAGALSASRYGIDVEPYRIEWIMDKDGFRNDKPAAAADIVVLGDSYLEYGATGSDTFVGRLQAKLPRLSARNLGKSGYSVGQYAVALKRFGLQYRPKIAIMAFYEGNDVSEMRDYLFWQAGRYGDVRGYLIKFTAHSWWRRYTAAVSSALVQIRKALADIAELALNKLAIVRGHAQRTHPEVAILNLNGRIYPSLLLDKMPEARVESMLATEEFQAIQQSFKQFRDICRANGITPILVYIPTPVHVYAGYTTEASGSAWLHMLGRQMAVKENVETAVKILADRAGIEVISLTPVFKAAADKGKMLYYALDPHWNAEGREAAASFIAGVLLERFLPKAAATGSEATDLAPIVEGCLARC
ncbi:MAG TPA: hypothetical protein VJQ55_04330 [Candidatus Binatia bacterium]|nr:hypothetical protein [Candidatus Binatia bacterium]